MSWFAHTAPVALFHHSNTEKHRMPTFATFIRPGAGAVGFAPWHRRVAFGERLATGRHSGLVHLEVDDPAANKLFAAFAGKLSVRQPTGFLKPSAVEVIDAHQGGPTLTLFLTPTITKAEPLWQTLSSTMAGRFTESTDAALNADAIQYLEYRNVNAQRAKDLLCKKIRTKNTSPGVCNDGLWMRFVAGDGSVLVAADEEIGSAGQAYISNTPPGRLQVAIGLCTRYGMADPGSWYQDMIASLANQAPPGADKLIAELLQPQPSLIDNNRSVAAVGAERVWPWPALLQYKRAKNLIYSDWRKLGNLQKELYRAQLLERVRPALAPANTSRFEYDIDDMSNLFQLEAVTEFYLNLPAPWDGASQPSAPNSNTYSSVNFLALYGNAAQLQSPQVVKLEDQLDMSRVMPGRDTLFLQADTARLPHKQYRIMSVDRTAQEVSLDLPPNFGGTSAWRIFHNPTLITIDAFGSRVRGAQAKTAGGQASQILNLESLSDEQLNELKRVNPFETISLSDVAQGSVHEARITEAPQIDRQNHRATVKVDHPMTPVINGSPWAIPAGVGGVQGQIAKPDNPPTNKQWGWDNYDGMLFLIAGGEVRCYFPWTSYTSRSTVFRGNNVGTEFHSSIKGNKVYRFNSVFSRNDYINLSFSVIDPDGLVWGDRMTAADEQRGGRVFPRVLITPDGPSMPPLVGQYQDIHFIQPQPPRFSLASIAERRSNTLLKIGDKFSAEVPTGPAPYWIAIFDGTGENFFYFKPELDSDSVPAGKPAPFKEIVDTGQVGKDGKKKKKVVESGKGGIRIHLGETSSYGSGSHGCQVSPYFMRLRMAMVSYHQEANATYYDENKSNPNLDKVPEVFTEDHKPALIRPYLGYVEELNRFQNDLKTTLADPLFNALDAALRAGNNEESLQVLRLALQEFEDRLQGVEDVADKPSEREIVPVVETLTELVAGEDVTTALEWARANSDRVSRAKQAIDELSKKIKDELGRWGWNDAMHGEYWLIRPDQRSD